MGEIMANNNIFCGDETTRIPKHNTIELKKKTYFHVGQSFALSLIHGGPAPKCLAGPVADYIAYGIERVKVVATDIPDPDKRTKIQQVSYVL